MIEPARPHTTKILFCCCSLTHRMAADGTGPFLRRFSIIQVDPAVIGHHQHLPDYCYTRLYFNAITFSCQVKWNSLTKDI